MLGIFFSVRLKEVRVLLEFLANGIVLALEAFQIERPDTERTWRSFHLANGTTNYNVLHAGMPVEEGHKVIITKWFREHGPGPMFYPD